MDYKKGYLAMFTALTELTAHLEKIYLESELPAGPQWVNMPLYLRTIQQRGEEACIGGDEDGGA